MVAVALALVAGFVARGALIVWPSIDAIMPLLVILAFLLLSAVASPRPKPTPPKPKADPDAAWREAADER
jgi:hypothetical protein